MSGTRKIEAFDGEPAVEALRAPLGEKLTVVAAAITDGFKEFTIGSGAWAVDLAAPPGTPTGGGPPVLRHLRLSPRRGGHAALVGGIVNPIEKSADLRDFDHAAILHRVRSGRALPITAPEWEQFLRKAEAVLNAAGIQSMRTPPPRELLEQRRSMERVSRGGIVAFVVVLVLAALVVWRVVLALSLSPP